MLLGKRLKNIVTGNVYEVIDEVGDSITLKGVGRVDVIFTLPRWMLRNYQEVSDELSALWEKFGDVPINENEEIDEDFYIWCKGTPREEIWHWFDERFPNGVAYLMYKTSKNKGV